MAFVFIDMQARACRALCSLELAANFVNTAPVPSSAKNKSFLFDPNLVAVGDWRGSSAAKRGCRVHVIATAGKVVLCTDFQSLTRIDIAH